MKASSLKRFLILFLVMSMAIFALAACDASEDDEGVLDDDDALLDEDEGLGDDTGGDFDTYDVNDDGFIDQSEFGTVAIEAGIDQAAFAIYDADADGLLAEDEFDTMMEDEGLLE